MIAWDGQAYFGISTSSLRLFPSSPSLLHTQSRIQHPRMSTSADVSAGRDSVRQRAQGPALSEGDSASGAQQPADAPNGQPRGMKTYGRTPGGTGTGFSRSRACIGVAAPGRVEKTDRLANHAEFVVFVVPTTHDMVSQLLDPREPKNLSDVIVLAILALHIFAAYYLPWNLKRPVFAAIFLFWRASYNVGIGYLLTVQSKYKLLVTWAKRWKLFEDPATGNNPRPWLYNLVKVELETKIPEDYKFDRAPLEYNTWLLFRRVVDLILMCDFISYCLFAIVCGHRPVGEAVGMTLSRWGAGLALVGFNLWVKLDAHRVVKDYAWYWGGKSWFLSGGCRVRKATNSCRFLLPH